MMRLRAWSLLLLLVVNCERVPRGPDRAPLATTHESHAQHGAGGGGALPEIPPIAPIVNAPGDLGHADPVLQPFDKSMFQSEFAGCGAELHNTPRDLYRALIRGTDDEKAAAALAVLKARRTQARTVVQRAISVVATQPYCSHLHPLTATLQDSAMDDITREQAALALGVIARDFPCTFPSGSCPQPHNPVPSWSRRALLDCATGKRSGIARACVESLGYVGGENPTLVSLRDDTTSDPMLRFFAGRALTRVTQTKQVTAGSLKDLVDSATEAAK